MEIIKHGRFYKAPQEKTCPDCGCVFSYVEKDINQNWVGINELNYTYINCPECGEIIIIEDFRK